MNQNKAYLKYFDRNTTLRLISKWSCGVIQMKASYNKPILGGHVHQKCYYYTQIRKGTELRYFISGLKQNAVSNVVDCNIFLKMTMRDIFNYYISPVQAKDIFKDYFAPKELIFWTGVEKVDIN